MTVSNFNYNIKLIESEIYDICQSFVSNKLNKKVKFDITNKIRRFLLDKKKEVSFFEVNDPKTLWQTWSFIQKVKWLFYNKLRFGKLEITIYNEALKSYLEGLSQVGYDENQLYNSEKWFKNEYWEYWFEKEPKEKIIIDIKVQPIKPVNYIEITTEIEGTQHEANYKV